MIYIMKNYIISLTILATLAFAQSCLPLDVAPPNSITDELIQKMLKGNDEAAKELIINAIGTSIENNFNLAGYSWSGYSSYPSNSQYDQDFLMSMRGNDVVLGVISTHSSDHNSAYGLTATYSIADNTYPYYALSAVMLTNANKVLNFMTAENAKLSSNVKIYRGRALALRAYAYMQLMERFQKAYTNGGADGKGMPIYTEYKLNDPAPISSAKDTYKFILDDLKEAVEALKESGYTADTKDVDLGVAQFLLARAALWCGEWDTCITACEDLTTKYSSFIKEANYGSKEENHAAVCAGTKEFKAEDNAFLALKNNPEAIMGFKNGDGSNDFPSLFNNVYGNGLSGPSNEATRIDERLYALIDENDFRKSMFTKEKLNYTYKIDNAGKTQTNEIPQYANLKYAASICLGAKARDHNNSCDNIVFRSSEVYLMLAEAYAQKNNATKTKEVLNILLAARTKAGAPALTCDTYSSMAGKTLLQMVQLQTRIELWLENGREFYNNKRWNFPVDRTSSGNHVRTVEKLAVSEMVLSIPKQEAATNTHWAD